MAMESITLFSRIADPAAVARRLRELEPSVEISGPDDSWRRAVITHTGEGPWRTLTFAYDPEAHTEPVWSTQMDAMRSYFEKFPDSERKPRLLELPSTFRFSVGTQFEPEFDARGDTRLSILFAIAELLDAVMFSPSTVRDARGRVLVSGDPAADDPEASWPRENDESPAA